MIDDFGASEEVSRVSYSSFVPTDREYSRPKPATVIYFRKIPIGQLEESFAFFGAV